ncbi:MAG: hypothetical protein D3913_12480 [Candidatus Electrothrix sp. LOE1_4_5]|nr:hypothetical protein [Candidatus Electrothrix gigas]MCI5190685.1 hypothetical protein [Candidatus Electrothrix gigas]
MHDSEINCWELKKCGREPGGKNIEKYGLCFVSVSINGRNGGQFCWSLRESACESIMQECQVNELKECRQCTFYISIQESEGFFSKYFSGCDETLSVPANR